MQPDLSTDLGATRPAGRHMIAYRLRGGAVCSHSKLSTWNGRSLRLKLEFTHPDAAAVIRGKRSGGAYRP